MIIDIYATSLFWRFDSGMGCYGDGDLGFA